MAKSHTEKQGFKQGLRAVFENRHTLGGWAGDIGDDDFRKNLRVFLDTVQVVGEDFHAVPTVTLVQISQVEPPDDIASVLEIACHICKQAAIRVREDDRLAALHGLEHIVFGEGIGLTGTGGTYDGNVAVQAVLLILPEHDWVFPTFIKLPQNRADRIFLPLDDSHCLILFRVLKMGLTIGFRTLRHFEESAHLIISRQVGIRPGHEEDADDEGQKECPQEAG